MPPEISMFIPISKVDAAQRLVYGVATAEVADKSGEIMDYETTKPLYQKWSDGFHKSTDGKSLGNVRAMHGDVAAGVVKQINYNDDKKQIEICAKIVDDAEWKKVEEGVYTGFSQGGKYIKRWQCPTDPALKRYTAEPYEVSIVDNPCVPTATFEFIKADGVAEQRKFKEADPVETNKKDPDVSQVWKAKDGSTFETKAEALKKNSEIDAAALAAPVMDALKEADAALTKAEGGEDDAKGADDADDKADDAAKKAATGEDEPADEEIAKGTVTGDLEKITSERDALAKTMGEITPMVQDLVKRIAMLEAQPMPPKGVVRAVSKGAEDDGEDALAKAQEALAKMTPDDRAHYLMKVTLAAPVQL